MESERKDSIDMENERRDCIDRFIDLFRAELKEAAKTYPELQSVLGKEFEIGMTDKEGITKLTVVYNSNWFFLADKNDLDSESDESISAKIAAFLQSVSERGVSKRSGCFLNCVSIENALQKLESLGETGRLDITLHDESAMISYICVKEFDEIFGLSNIQE